jgi:hypothetical protein
MCEEVGIPEKFKNVMKINYHDLRDSDAKTGISDF